MVLSLEFARGHWRKTGAGVGFEGEGEQDMETGKALSGRPGGVAIRLTEDWEENCIRVEDATDLELNRRATELLAPRSEGDLLGVFTAVDGRLWAARVNTTRSRGDPNGLTWYDFEDTIRLIEERANQVLGPAWIRRDRVQSLREQIEDLTDEKRLTKSDVDTLRALQELAELS
ncbi:MAG: hypothetical protein HY900_33410 [Deltaproteobacteria bacterium]|nr:hypothetical protein [Deltaproteobacteria bacterium]